MENRDGGDDQASGWMQVKKKHRSNLKFSLHGWVEGLSGKQRSGKTNKQLSSGQKLKSSINATQSFNASKDCAVHDGSNATISTEEEAIEHYLDKCVVSQNSENLDSSHLAATHTIDPIYKLVVNQESAHKDNVFPKIKWGDLDEGTLIHCGKAPGAELKFGGIKNYNLVSVKAESAGEYVSCVVPLDPEENRFVGGAIYEDQFLLKSHSLSPRTISVEKTTKEVNEVSLDVKDFKPENEETNNKEMEVMKRDFDIFLIKTTNREIIISISKLSSSSNFMCHKIGM